MNKDRAYYRYQHKKHALRHKRITEEVYQEKNYFNDFNKYDTFKIHCSCPLCSAKTNNKGKHSSSPPFNPSISDIRKIEQMDAQEQDFTSSAIVDAL